MHRGCGTTTNRGCRQRQSAAVAQGSKNSNDECRHPDRRTVESCRDQATQPPRYVTTTLVTIGAERCPSLVITVERTKIFLPEIKTPNRAT